jgi:crotonobetainyl-CoA:carnitine CoA-transferase CaiB-like acyl-CoA transferase
LSDLGAEVIKIEPPEGDMWRRGVPQVGGVSISFAQMNAGKRFMCVDLRNQKGRKLVFDLASQSDIVIENYRPGVAQRLGLGYEEVSKENQEVIYCSISGYGQEGPARNRRAYAPIIHAELGLLDQNAKEWGTEPRPETASHVDFSVGMQASNGILAALYQRAMTGKGAYIDASMAETMLAMNEATAVEVNGGLKGQHSPFRPGKAAVVQVADGTWAQLPGNPSLQVFRVASVLNKKHELHARGWISADQVDPDQAIEQLRTWAIEIESTEALEMLLDKYKIPVGVVRSIAESAEADWAIERGAFTEIEVENGTAKIPTSPLRIKDSVVGPRSGVYRLGIDNRSILSERLGISESELDLLESEQVLICEEKTE